MRFVSCTYEAHASAILDILNEAIINSTALYDYMPRTMESMAGWFNAKAAANFPVIGVEDDTGILMGFASYGTFRAWPAYKYSVENALYIHKDHRGKGLGFSLMGRLIELAKEQQYHTIIGGIDMDNAASIALHQKLGFVHSGTIRQAAFKFGRWLDLGFYQLILETPFQPIDG
ncbi:GNAT family N-acetyltransferase [Noviherbaspirillum sedimenti]|uniref:N-acetyltransferase family protein n=1 Tax=Noviherbaspirillum sedimenti TaxID=2320865 RepID=A0A3A3FZ92_9BURK|nr:GNAT family N-acetyltransferase [Noviherbaspirillum sedimenti]RJG01477.1 N-acetyltransferase family protein [Noviherbaspirillum sedimenti]